MRSASRGKAGFTIIELLIVVIVIGILAAAGLAKYQNFAEVSRRKTCLGQLKQIEQAVAVWETATLGFAANSKCAFGFTTRTGKLTNNTTIPTINPVPPAVGSTIPSIADTQLTVGGPDGFVNTGPGATGNSGPLNQVIRDDNIWVCPSALSRYYNGEKQNVPDDYLDTTGGGVAPIAHGGTPVGLTGRYVFVIAGRGNDSSGATPIRNGGFPAGWIVDGSPGNPAATANTLAPCPQVPFKIAICGCYGTFGDGAGPGDNSPGTVAGNQGGPVGPDGSTLNRHSARW
ncbi:MAG: prepilin-type N-terminal cleavage/methylation domain-containing protein [Candidatus Wallbacteria bacterium]|nr:prepilin-type N-terminal cleavage/methylation domain-containing protein [Candidatus Wallbacteria bacterium]